MKHLLPCILTICLLASMALPVVIGQENPVSILSSNGQINNSLKQYQILGEVQNTGSEPLKYVMITAVFYNAKGIEIGSDYTYSCLNILHPSERSPFTLLFEDSTLSAQVDHYTLSTEYRTATARPQQLIILSNTTTYEKSGVKVTGELQNTGEDPSSFTQVIATFYNSKGKIVDVNNAFVNSYPDALSYEEIYAKLYTKAAFQITSNASVSSYRLTAQSINYALLDSAAVSPTPTLSTPGATGNPASPGSTSQATQNPTDPTTASTSPNKQNNPTTNAIITDPSKTDASNDPAPSATPTAPELTPEIIAVFLVLNTALFVFFKRKTSKCKQCDY